MATPKPKKKFKSGGIYFTVDLEPGALARLNRALKVLGETDAPFLKKAWEDVGDRYTNEVRARAKGSVKGGARSKGVESTRGGVLKTGGIVEHPAAKALEFGRKYFYRGYKGRKQKKTGQLFMASPGMRAQPYVGVLDKGHAHGATLPYARERLTEAISQEWERIGSES